MLTTDLEEHVALVTGATGGIGKATCHSLASLRCTVAAHYNANEEGAKALIEELRHQGVKAESFQADLTGYEAVRSNAFKIGQFYENMHYSSI